MPRKDHCRPKDRVVSVLHHLFTTNISEILRDRHNRGESRRFQRRTVYLDFRCMRFGSRQDCSEIDSIGDSGLLNLYRVGRYKWNSKLDSLERVALDVCVRGFKRGRFLVRSNRPQYTIQEEDLRVVMRRFTDPLCITGLVGILFSRAG